MNAKRLVEFGDERRWQLTYACADPLDDRRVGLAVPRSILFPNDQWFLPGLIS